MSKNIYLGLAMAAISLGATSCDKQATEAEPQAKPEADLVWAVNVGGPAFQGIDGTRYEADSSISGGEIGQMEVVKGSQDPVLYHSYREGDIRVTREIPNGTYDITFHFAEPRDFGHGDRLFDVFVGDTAVIRDLDVMLARDGKIDSALTVTVRNVEIDGGELNVRFEAKAADPILSALVVRKRYEKDSNWKLVWSDEFDYEGPPDPDKWKIDEWPARVVNDEDQAYTAREKNLRVEDGRLIIEAFKEQYDNAEYTSGRLHTDGKGDFLYGRIEVRAKLPRGMGTWAAIWMLPSNPFTYATTCKPGDVWQGSETCDAWPNSGEIDIMEHVGYEMGHVHGTVHNEAYYWAKWEQRKGRILLDDVDTAFHDYELEWTPDDIRIFVDGHHYFTYVNERNGWQTWPFDQPFHVILNVAIGGMWGRSGGGIDDDIFPQRMEVEYVRYYERDE